MLSIRLYLIRNIQDKLCFTHCVTASTSSEGLRLFSLSRNWLFLRSAECWNKIKNETMPCFILYCTNNSCLDLNGGSKDRSLSFTITVNLSLICSVLIKPLWFRPLRCGAETVARRPDSTLPWWNLQRPAIHYYSIPFHFPRIILHIFYFGTESDLFITLSSGEHSSRPYLIDWHGNGLCSCSRFLEILYMEWGISGLDCGSDVNVVARNLYFFPDWKSRTIGDRLYLVIYITFTLGLHNISFQHQYCNVHILNSHNAASEMLSFDYSLPGETVLHKTWQHSKYLGTSNVSFVTLIKSAFIELFIQQRLKDHVILYCIIQILYLNAI